MWKWVLGVIVLAGIGVGFARMGAKGAPVRTATARRGPISAYVEERARTTLPRVWRLTMPLDGRVKPIVLQAGAKVTQGQVVARMDDADLRSAVTEAEARLDAIKARIGINRYNAIEETALKESDSWINSFAAAVAAAGKKVEASKAREEYAKWWQDSNEKMFTHEATSQKELKLARMESAEAQVGYQADQFNLHAMETIQGALRLAPVYVRQFLDRKVLSREVLLKQQTEAEAVLARARRDLTRAALPSPIAGVVLKRHVSNERVLPAGAPLLDLGRLEDLEITADVLSQEVGDVKPGDPVDVYGPAIGPAPIGGKVARVKPEGFTKISSLGVEQQRVEVVIAIDQDALAAMRGQGRELGVGYRVRVRIHTASKADALTIPRTALFRGSWGQWQAFAVREGTARLLDVDIGLSNDKQAEIESGLALGDTVIVAPPASLVSGTRVAFDAGDQHAEP